MIAATHQARCEAARSVARGKRGSALAAIDSITAVSA